MSITQTAAKLCIFGLALLAFLDIAPVSAASVIFLANPPAGSDGNPCSFASPCQTLDNPIVNGKLDPNGQVTCAQGTAFGLAFFPIQSMTIDCPGLFVPQQTAVQGVQAAGSTVKIRHLTFNGQFANSGSGGVSITGGANSTLILEDCVFENFSGTTIQIAASGSYSLILRNTRIVSNGTVAVVLKPATGGSINATFDHVTVAKNGGGGIRVDTTNGPVTVDVTDSEISDNLGNGVGVVGGAGGAAVVSIGRTVIAKNGQAGVSSSGATAGVMVDTTLLDSNGIGATSVASGGHILTYSNNRIVGTSGSGFTGTASLQ